VQIGRYTYFQFLPNLVILIRVPVLKLPSIQSIKICLWPFFLLTLILSAEEAISKGPRCIYEVDFPDALQSTDFADKFSYFLVERSVKYKVTSKLPDLVGVTREHFFVYWYDDCSLSTEPLRLVLEDFRNSRNRDEKFILRLVTPKEKAELRLPDIHHEKGICQ
jgi:hypothetical protein